MRDARYEQCGVIAKAIGEAMGVPVVWGGDWALEADGCKPDFDHIQMRNWRTA